MSDAILVLDRYGLAVSRYGLVFLLLLWGAFKFAKFEADAIEPLVPSDPSQALGLALKSEIPLVREYIARRAVDDALTKAEASKRIDELRARSPRLSDQ